MSVIGSDGPIAAQPNRHAKSERPEWMLRPGMDVLVERSGSNRVAATINKKRRMGGGQCVYIVGRSAESGARGDTFTNPQDRPATFWLGARWSGGVQFPLTEEVSSVISVIEECQEPLDGVVVLYYPPGQTLIRIGNETEVIDNSALAARVALQIRKGSIVAVCRGYGWDLKFITGDPGQVTVQEVSHHDQPHRFKEDYGTSKLENGEQVNRYRGCYVFVGQAPQKIWECYKRGEYTKLDKIGAEWRSQHVRFGSYGDPCAVPIGIWNKIAAFCAGWTGYTHQWRRFGEYRHLLMASVESQEDATQARNAGWRTFRVAETGEQPMPGEFHCPASAEQGYRKTCQQCGACDGTYAGSERASVLIWPHGPPAAVKSFYRIVKGESPVITHRQEVNEADEELITVLRELGTASAATVAERSGRGTQAIATRMWHLRQMGIVRRVSRGQYQLTTEA